MIILESIPFACGKLHIAKKFAMGRIKFSLNYDFEIHTDGLNKLVSIIKWRDF